MSVAYLAMDLVVRKWGVPFPRLRERLRVSSPRRPALVGCAGLLLLVPASLLPIPTLDENHQLLKGLVGLLRDNVSRPAGPVDRIVIRDAVAEADAPRSVPFTEYAGRPDIIVLMIESISGRFLKEESPLGGPVMKNFLDLTAEGFFVTDYYSNSIQTSRSQFAALFSQIPSYRQKEFTDFGHITFRSLAGILRDHGYATAFVKAYSSINFDDSGDFLRRNGFGHAFSLYDFLTEQEKDAVWGWGPEDRVFYRHIPDFLGRIRSGADRGKPVFLVLHTVMNHMYFERVPEERKALYPRSGSLYQNYANSLHLVDQQLLDFRKVLEQNGLWEDSIIVITGDHGFPFGEHEVRHNELCYYEEVFRLPFLLVARGHVPPHRESARRFSHLDLAPTILDLLGVRRVKNTFVGSSMLRRGDPSAPVYNIQPYDGGYLVVSRGDIKYLHHRASGRRFCFDLGSDPLEKHPFPAAGLDDLLRSAFEDDIRYIETRQMALERNRIAPATVEAAGGAP